MSKNIHFIQVESGGEDILEYISDEVGRTTGDNVIITNHMIQPLKREEALLFLEEMARTLDVAEEMNIDWEEVYKEENIV